MPRAKPPRAPARGAPCPRCAGPRAGDERYCLSCGAGLVDVLRDLAPRPRSAPVTPAAQLPGRRRPAFWSLSLRAGGRLPLPALPALRTPGRAQALALVAQLRGRPLPGGPRGALLALAAALALGIAAGGAATSAPRAARSAQVVVSAPAATAASAAASGDLGSLARVAAPAGPSGAIEPSTADVAPSEPAAGGVGGSPAGAPSGREAPSGRSGEATGDDAGSAAPRDDAPASTPDGDGPAPARPPVRHVVVVALAEAGYAEAFGAASRAPYLTREARAKGVLLRRYHAIAHGNAPNLVALLSGQGPNPQTAGGCADLAPFVATGPPLADGQLRGGGCVFGAELPTLLSQLDAKRLPWRAYVEGSDRPAGTPPAPCAPPAPAADGSPAPVDRNPLLFFAAVAGAPDCSARVAGMGALAADLATPAQAAPAFTLVLPDACHGGRAGACPAGTPDGLPAADAWLREWLPRLLAAPAYAADGLVVVTFAEARASGRLADSSSCCSDRRPVNEPAPVDPQAPATGGGRVGALVLSPHAKPGAASAVPYNHLSLLRTVEDAFGLEHLGLAGADGLRPFGDDVLARR